MTEIAFRPCQPSDVDAAVPLIYSSGPAAFDYVFCDRLAEQSLAFLRQTFVRGKSEFGYQQHTAVLQANRVVGIGAVRTADQNWGFTLAAATEIMRFYGVAGGLRTIRRGLKIEQVIQPPKGKVGILYHLAVAPDSQSKGLGSALIDHLLADVAARNLPTAALDVAVTNPRAQALYERLGFVPQVTRTGGLKTDLGRVVNHTFLTLSLS